MIQILISAYHPQGFIVEYGGTPGDPVLNLSASTRIKVASIVSTSSDSNCGSGILSLEAIPSSGDIIWFDSPTGGNQLATGNTFTTPIITSTTSYYALASVNGCLDGVRTEVQAIINNVPQITSTSEAVICESGSATISALASEGTINWYESNTGGISIGSGDSFTTPDINVTTTYFAEAITSQGCISVTRTPVTVTVEYITLPIGNTTQTFCASDLATIADLSITGASVLWYDDVLGENLLNNADELVSATYYATQTINGCESQTFAIDVIVIPGPEFEIDDTSIYCLGGNPIELETFNPSGNYSYQWTDETGAVISNLSSTTVENGGVYTVVATSPSTGCTSIPVDFTVVESEVANISLDDITIVDLSDSNTITINNSNNNLGVGDYEFNLDNEYGWYQDEPYFNNVSSGSHILYVRDKNECGVVELEVFVLGFPKYFTPNGDGDNDTWNLKGYNNLILNSSFVRIFDRYGKLIKQISPSTNGWDGTFNGELLKANDYWFEAELIQIDGTTRVFRGHFSLLR